MADAVDYTVFYEQLSELVAGRETGTLFFKNDANHVAVIGVRSGTIVSLLCGPKRGRSAVELIRESREGTVRLDRGAVAFHEHELPSTQEILDLLSPFHDATRAVSAGRERAAGGMAAGVAGRARLLCSLLTEFIGPVAPLVCEERIVSAGGLSGAGQMDEVVRDLAREIEDPEEAEEFVRRALEALELGGGSGTAAAGTSGPETASAIDIAALKERLCDVLTDYLGPVAPLVCEERMSALGDGATREQLGAAITGIAAEIGEGEEAAAFVEEAWQQINELAR